MLQLYQSGSIHSFGAELAACRSNDGVSELVGAMRVVSPRNGVGALW